MDGTCMGSPISSILTETFLQNLEKLFCLDIIKHRHILYITRYVNDILIIYDSAKITAESILANHDAMHPNMKYKMECENNEQINFLDFIICRMNNEIMLRICNKPTKTDTVISNSSNHPKNDKMAAFNCMLDRVHRLPITYKNKVREMEQIS
jgi:hypothetical protein